MIPGLDSKFLEFFGLQFLPFSLLFSELLLSMNLRTTDSALPRFEDAGL